MDSLDMQSILSSMENRFSDNLPLGFEQIEESINAKVEAQKWCLGLTLNTELSYHLDVNGFLQNKSFVGLRTVSHTADEDYEVGNATNNPSGNSVIDEAIFLKNLGISLKSIFSGLTFQQFASPMGKMRGAGGSGWTLHNTGEAIDLFYANNNALADWLINNAFSLELRTIIDYRNKRSWNSKRKSWKFSEQIDPSYGHIHIDRGGYRRNGQGLSPEEAEATQVRSVIGGL